MATDNKILQLIVKLARLTTEGVLKWEISDKTHPLIVGTDNIVSISYNTNDKDKVFAVYQERYRDYSMEFEQFYHSERIIFAIVDNQYRVLWEHWEHSSALRNLFEAVRDQSSGINDVIDSLLAEDDENLKSNKEALLTF